MTPPKNKKYDFKLIIKALWNRRTALPWCAPRCERPQGEKKGVDIFIAQVRRRGSILYISFSNHPLATGSPP
ncbi:MAG: hypothetical protein QF745_11195, partial [Planctomycetota bacterium]|nr:hypothetical protein [Planctomycetota bacterium]